MFWIVVKKSWIVYPFSKQNVVMTVSETRSKISLLSRTDQQLALTNVVGFTAYSLFGTCLSSEERSAAFKTAATYVGFAIRGLNFFWRQHLIGSLPLADKYSLVKKAVSPLGVSAAHGLAFAAGSLQEENAALVGWGLCQVPSIASAATVAHHSLQKLGRSIRELPTRPKEALPAISIHLLNLTAELGRAIVYWQNTTGTKEWRQEDQFFEQSEMSAARFVHALSNPGWKIAALQAKSQETLDGCLQQVSAAAAQPKVALPEANSIAELLKSWTDHIESKTTPLAKTLAAASPYLTSQAADKANTALTAYKSAIVPPWCEVRDRLLIKEGKELQRILDGFSSKTLRQLEKAQDFNAVFEARRGELQQTCDDNIKPIDTAAAGLSDDYPARALLLFKQNVTEGCGKAQGELESQITDAIAKRSLKEAEDVYGRFFAWFYKPSTPKGALGTLLDLAVSSMRKVGEDAEAAFSKIPTPQDDQRAAYLKKTREDVQQSIQNFEKKLNEANERVYSRKRWFLEEEWPLSSPILEVTPEFKERWKQEMADIRSILTSIKTGIPARSIWNTRDFAEWPNMLQEYKSEIRESSKELSDIFQKISGSLTHDWERSILDGMIKEVQERLELAESRLQWGQDEACFFDLSLGSYVEDVQERAKYVLSRLERFDNKAYQNNPAEYVKGLADRLISVMPGQPLFEWLRVQIALDEDDPFTESILVQIDRAVRVLIPKITVSIPS